MQKYKRNMLQPKGTLIPIGGNEDKNLEHDKSERRQIEEGN